MVTGGLSWLAIALGRLTRHGIVVVDTAHRPRLGSDAGVTWGRGKGVRGGGVRGDCSVNSGGGGSGIIRDCSVKGGGVRGDFSVNGWGGSGGIRGIYEGSMRL